MAQPDLVEDIKIVTREIKEELQKTFRFYRAQSREASAKRKMDYQAKFLEIGPVNWLRFAVGLLISIVVITAFSLAHLHWGWILIIAIFLIAWDIAFAKGYILPILQEVWTIIKTIIVDIFGHGVKDFVKEGWSKGAPTEGK